MNTPIIVPANERGTNIISAFATAGIPGINVKAAMIPAKYARITSVTTTGAIIFFPCFFIIFPPFASIRTPMLNSGVPWIFVYFTMNPPPGKALPKKGTRPQFVSVSPCSSIFNSNPFRIIQRAYIPSHPQSLLLLLSAICGEAPDLYRPPVFHPPHRRRCQGCLHWK